MYCETPNIILSRTLYRVLDRFGRKCVYTDGFHFYPIHGKLPSPAAVGATYDNYKNWAILTEDGELIPMFTAVPCGKCLLCRNKRAKEWSTRATCESETAVYPPVFITLTYADWFRPDDGVRKEDVQKFIKRFRENWIRKCHGDRLDLRYFACGEYGSKHGLPHYHLLFWNVPNDKCNESLMTRKILYCIKRSWCKEITKDEYNNIPAKYDFLRFKSDGKYYTLLGRVEVTCDRGSSGAYCMKYMRKPKDVPVGWSLPTFYLSSRRTGGIGMRYLNNIIDSIRNQNPAQLSIPTKVGEFGLPRCFKDKLFPSLSMIIPTHIRCQLVRFEKIYKVLQNKCQTDDQCDMFKYMRDSLREQYGQVYDFIQHSEHLYHEGSDLFCLKRGRIYDEILNELYQKMHVCFIQCYDFQPDVKKLDYYVRLKDKRKEILAKMKFPEIDVDYEHYKVNNRLRAAQREETF